MTFRIMGKVLGVLVVIVIFQSRVYCFPAFGGAKNFIFLVLVFPRRWCRSLLRPVLMPVVSLLVWSFRWSFRRLLLVPGLPGPTGCRAYFF